MELKIYDKSYKKVERIAKAGEYDLFYGTVEIVMELIDVDKISNNFDILKIVIKCKDEIICILKEVFADVTDDEWKRVKIKDIVGVLMDIIKSTITGINLLKSEKN